MKAFVKSKLILGLIVLILLAGAVIIPLAGKITHTHAQGTLTITEFPVPTSGSQLWCITSGPDGNLWFTENTGNNIGRITPGGTVTEFPVPTSASGLTGITTGPDGNLWFTEHDVSKIGKITPSGTITEFPLSNSGSYP